MVKMAAASCHGHVAWLPFVIIKLLLVLNVIAVTTTVVTNPRIIEHPETQYVAKNEPATLNCKAEGDPAPVITWYRNNEPVITANENPSSHRMLLPSGQLFFLRIIHNKNNKPDVGVYHCVATNPVNKISVQSNNATLEIAVMRDDFRETPQNTEVGIGDTAIMRCKPPKGLPEPRIKWKKDGEMIHPHGRITVHESGNLIIQDARRDDSGNYICVAHNIAGEKETNPARLLVKEKPKFIRSPQDILVEENEDVEFSCQATGDPPPTIIWKREEEPIPQGRSHILEDRSLRIDRVKVSDEGIYICRAENTVGYMEAVARLTVHSHPTFIVTPQDKVVGMGRTVSLRCEVTGNPPPAVFWNKETSQILMFPRQDHGRFSVSNDGTLIIEPVRKEDSGEYVCQALSVAGSAFAKARITVKDVDPRPPPIIHQGPQNQTLPINSVAMLQCHSSGDPPPSIRWFKDRRLINNDRDPRIAMLDSGTLQISDLNEMDSGLYMCKALSETGETTWSAALTVEAPTNPTVIFHRTPEPSTFPGPPSKPIIEDIEETSMKLTWKSNANHGASPVIEYTTEYFSHETGEGWVVASESIKGQSFVVRGLRPDTSYMFLVRARNSHGLSLPSQVAGPFRTKGGTGGVKPTVTQFATDLVEEKLSGQVVRMNQPDVISSTAIKLNWEIQKSHRYIEGFHIKYRVTDLYQQHMSRNQKKRVNEYTTETVDSGSATMYVLRNLHKYTWYEIRVQPFYMAVQGQESNMVRARTFEDVPSAPPQNIVARLLDNATLQLSWSPPPSQHHNGPLRGYKIFCLGNETKFHRNITVNSTTHVILIRHLVRGMPYRIHLAAYNRMGIGVRSDPYIMGGESAQGLIQGFVKEPWFIATLIGTIGGTLWFALCVFSIWLYRKKKARKKFCKNGVMTVPVHKTEDPARMGPIAAGNLIPLLLQPSESSTTVENLQPDIASSSERSKEEQMKENLYNTPNVVPPPMKTFYNKNAMPVAPYATTTLITNNLLNKGGESAFRPILTGYNGPASSYNTHPGSSTESCIKNDPPSGESNSDNSQNREEEALRMKPGGMKPVLFLPPPPEHPPPSDIGTPPDSPTYPHPQGGSYGGGQPLQFSESEYAQALRNSDRFAPQRGSQGSNSLRGNHQGHPADYRPQSPKCRTMSPRAHMEMRAYSPRAMSEPERGPTPPIRGYKLVPLREGEGPMRHFSDTEGAPAPPLRMLHGSPPPPAPGDDDPMMDRAIQSSLPSLVGDGFGAYTRPGPDNNPDYVEDSDLENMVQEIQQGRSPDSSVGEPDLATVTGSMLAAWASVTDNSDTNCSSNRSSALSSSDGSFFAEADFASAVAKAAELSGLTVIGTTVTDPNARERAKVRKSAKQRERAPRPTSPYSTDSNYSTVNVPHRPYPKSERKRQLAHAKHPGHHHHHKGSGLSGMSGMSGLSGGDHTPSQERKPRPAARAKPPINMRGNSQLSSPMSDMSPYYKQNYPGSPMSVMSMGSAGRQRSAAGTPKSPTAQNGIIDAPPLRLNPLTSAFDTTDTPIV